MESTRILWREKYLFADKVLIGRAEIVAQLKANLGNSFEEPVSQNLPNVHLYSAHYLMFASLVDLSSGGTGTQKSNFRILN